MLDAARLPDMKHTIIDSPIGDITLVATDGVLSGVCLDGQLHRSESPAFGPRVGSGFEEITEQLGEYFAGDRCDFTVRTRAVGTDFQRRVWQAVATIPYGQTWTYGQLAGTIRRPDRLRAVAATNGRNPLVIVVPCHRVVGSDGSLTGYAGGLVRKRFLLDLERPMARLF